jgi:hypothetical protein
MSTVLLPKSQKTEKRFKAFEFKPATIFLCDYPFAIPINENERIES